MPPPRLKELSKHPASATASVALVAIHLDLISKPWATKHFWMGGPGMVCLSAHQVRRRRKPLNFTSNLNRFQLFTKSNLVRLASAPVEHAGDVHLATCLVSLLIKVIRLD